MAGHDLHLAVLEGVGLGELVIQVVLAHPQQQLVGVDAKRGERDKYFKYTTISKYLIKVLGYVDGR